MVLAPCRWILVAVARQLERKSELMNKSINYNFSNIDFEVKTSSSGYEEIHCLSHVAIMASPKRSFIHYVRIRALYFKNEIAPHHRLRNNTIHIESHSSKGNTRLHKQSCTTAWHNDDKNMDLKINFAEMEKDQIFVFYCF